MTATTSVQPPAGALTDAGLVHRRSGNAARRTTLALGFRDSPPLYDHCADLDEQKTPTRC